MTIIEYIYNKDVEIECMCTTKHVPKPMVYFSIDGQVLCPASFLNLVDLLKEYELTGDTPDGSVTKHYGKFVRDMAELLYREGVTL